MKNKNRLLTMERRSTRRYDAKDGIYAALKSGRMLVGKIENIGKGGLCFRYLGDPEGRLDPQNAEMTLFSYSHGFFLDNIKCRVVRDVPDLKDPSFLAISMRVVAVEFSNIDSDKDDEIVRLIDDFCFTDSRQTFSPENFEFKNTFGGQMPDYGKAAC